MSEEEVSQALAEKNKEIYDKKLLKDIDLNFENLKLIFENTINIFSQEMNNRTYEILFDSENSISRDEINIKIKDFFDKLKEYINKTIDNNHNLLTEEINKKDYMRYINQISTLSGEFYTSLGELYQKEAESLLKELTNNLDNFSKTRLEKLIKEIIYNHFMMKAKSSISNSNLILNNNYQENNYYLEYINEKTVK